ncbi:MAG: hypothetical protein U9R75_12410, partial [Candidatus Thermoplasmatota archaeon]|nr:hypothetical protein [Candidatus Thermoplasmatota archaeon]
KSTAGDSESLCSFMEFTYSGHENEEGGIGGNGLIIPAALIIIVALGVGIYIYHRSKPRSA